MDGRSLKNELEFSIKVGRKQTIYIHVQIPTHSIQFHSKDISIPNERKPPISTTSKFFAVRICTEYEDVAPGYECMIYHLHFLCPVPALTMMHMSVQVP